MQIWIHVHTYVDIENRHTTSRGAKVMEKGNNHLSPSTP